MDKIEQIQTAIDMAKIHGSKLTDEALRVPGFTSIKIRHLLNNLGAISTNYLEVGSHKGATFCSACFNNPLKETVAIDNYSEFNMDGDTKAEFLDNADSFVCMETVFALIEADCFTVKDLGKSKFDLYLYDGQHTESSQQRAVTHFLPNLTDEFIFVVDDWSFSGVESGTRNGIKLAGLETLFECILETKEGERENDAWHNSLAVFLLKQTKQWLH
jgi:hypothetical protein